MQSWKWGMWSRKWNLKCVYSKANAIYLILFIIVISLNKCCVWERLKNEKTSFKLVLLLLLLHFGKLEDIHHVKPWNTLDFGHFTVTGLALVKLISKFCFQLSPTGMTRVRLNSSKKRIFHKFRKPVPGSRAWNRLKFRKYINWAPPRRAPPSYSMSRDWLLLM